jgi:vancomycin resistance protein YoaR
MEINARCNFILIAHNKKNDVKERMKYTNSEGLPLRKGYLIFLLFGLASIIILLSGCSNHSVNRKNMETKPTNNNITQPTPVEAQEKPAVQEEKQGSTSGPVTAVPWETDNKFKSKQEETGALIQMAAFSTVLHDPMPGEEQNVHLAARILAGTVLQPGQTFSQNQTIGPYSRARGFQKGPMYLGSELKTTIGGGVCKMASTLYNVAILCNLPIVERYAHGMPVPYVPYGQDATVAYGDKDFQFKNNLSYPILIWAQGVDTTLYVAFYGQSEPPRVEWHHQFLYRQKAERIYRQNTSLSTGKEKVIVEGMDGAGVRSWVTVTNMDGTSTIRTLSSSYYLSMPYIIEKRSVANVAP